VQLGVADFIEVKLGTLLIYVYLLVFSRKQ